MTQDDVLFGYRLQLFDLAARTTVTNACRVFGVHRSTYYGWKAQVDRQGLEMLRPRERRRPVMPNQLSPVLEQRIVAFALGHPGLGPRRVSAQLARREWGDNGNEFRSRVFTETLADLRARHTRIRSGRPQTNGHVERLHRTILEECWRPVFARFLQVRFTGLKRELARYVTYYNHQRAHTGRITAGRCPAELVYGARKMEPR